MNNLRRDMIKLHDLTGIDKEYIFYYDETNNSRVSRLKESDFNSKSSDFFILGGLLHEKKQQPTEESIECLYQKLDYNYLMKEIKFRNICNRKFKFEEFLNLRKVISFLSWIDSNNLLVHYYYADLHYYSLVDIIDSILNVETLELSHNIKSSLYESLKSTGQLLPEMLVEFNYPNIKNPDLFLLLNST